MSKHKKRLSTEPAMAQIKRLSHDSRGVATINGKTTFIFGGLADETVEFHYERYHNRFDEGRLTAVLQNPNPERIDPICPHFSTCGGCQLQHLHHSGQIQHKQSVLLELFAQHNLIPKRILPPLYADIWGYRRKARLSVKYVNKKGTVLVGFRERMSNLVADINGCAVLHPNVGNKIEALKVILSQLEGRSQIPQIEAAVTDNTTALIIRHLHPLSEKDALILQAFGHEHQLTLYLQPGGPESIVQLCPSSTTQKIEKLYYLLKDYNLTLYFLPQQFVQINDGLNQLMIKQALELLDLKSHDHVLDLFCGIGNFSLPMATQAAHVTGIEGESLAVEQANENANHNHLFNCKFYCSNLTTPPWQPEWANQRYSKILLDPPRTGAEAICENIRPWQADTILYISCNPATMVRDACILKNNGYQLSALGMMDMFAQTKHVEAMALFQRG